MDYLLRVYIAQVVTGVLALAFFLTPVGGRMFVSTGLINANLWQTAGVYALVMIVVSIIAYKLPVKRK